MSASNDDKHLIWRYPILTLTVIWVVCSLLLAVMGPFGSYLSMNFTGRLVYWSLVVAGGTYLAHFLRWCLLRCLGNRWNRFTFDSLMGALFAGCYTPLLYYATDYVTEGRAPYSMLEMVGFVLAVTAVLVVIREVLGLHAPGLEPSNQEAAGGNPVEVVDIVATLPEPEMPPIVERLPDETRGAIWAISGSDHYVDIRTEAGSSSILLRFSDALREVEPVPGQRVHRSHWVADAAVARMRRDGKRHFVVLKTGDELPVSRTYAHHAHERWGAAAE